MNRTKIVATYGPAIAEFSKLVRLIEAGVDVFRLNFSHGDLREKAEAVKQIRVAARQTDAVVGIVGDLCGQKIRLTRVEGGSQVVVAGARVVIEGGFEPCTGFRLGTNYAGLSGDVKPGHRLLIDDGVLVFRVEGVEGGVVEAVCEVGGVIRDRKGVNLPDTHISLPSLTEKDFTDLYWAMENELDYVCVSFVRSAGDIQQVLDRIAAAGSSLRVIAKIEKREALDQLEQIVRLSHGVMVARGDLGVEMPMHEVPLLQKEITQRCQRLGKPCIIATQMLQSMVEQPTATRAEVNDVANAVLDSTDAVMLSAETSVGKYPVEAVELIARIGVTTEAYLDRMGRHVGAMNVHEAQLPITSGIASGVSRLVAELPVKLVAVWTLTGNTVRLLSKNRLSVPILGLTSDLRTLRRMALHYGVRPVFGHPSSSFSRLIAETNDIVLRSGYAVEGDWIVVVVPRAQDTRQTSSIFIHPLGPASLEMGVSIS